MSRKQERAMGWHLSWNSIFIEQGRGGAMARRLKVMNGEQVELVISKLKNP
jgi:hypothetical protein